MSGGFVKLYSSVVTSSLWTESPITKLCWLTLLIVADADGRVEGSVPGIARLIGVSVDDFETALAVFIAPDRYSRTKTDDGRRLREIPGGWELVNHAAYREKRSPKQLRQAAWVADKRAERQSGVESTDVDMSTGVDAVDPQMSDVRERSISSDSASPHSDMRPHFGGSEQSPANGRAQAASRGSEQNTQSASPNGGPGPSDGTEATPAADSLRVVREVFDAWRELHGHPTAKLEHKRTTRIRSALKSFSRDQLVKALRGALKDDWLMGRDPRSPRKYDGLETLLRDAAQIERLIELEDGRCAVANQGQGKPTKRERFL